MAATRMRVGETVRLEVDFSRLLESVWRPGTSFSTNAYARPPVPNGVEYQATTGGQTDTEEPDWPAVGSTVTDGSVVWTGVAFGTNATDTISDQSVTAPTGLTAATATESEMVVSSLITAVSRGCYGVVFEVDTANSETLQEVFTVVVE